MQLFNLKINKKNNNKKGYISNTRIHSFICNNIYKKRPDFFTLVLS